MDVAAFHYPVYPLHGIAEPISALSHLLGAAVFACLSIVLIRRTRGSRARMHAVKVYCGSIISLLVVSGLYHLFPRDFAVRELLQRLDHATIFIVIAATFTPIHVALFENVLRWGMLALVWTLAVVGVLLSILFLRSVPESVCLIFYLGLGWLGAVSGLALWMRYGFAFVVPLLLGALSYTTGALGDFFHYPVIISGIVGPHEVFHVAVIAGISCHWWFISAFAHRAVVQCETTGNFLLAAPER